jgi:Flp pilus assembly pilin Flp
MRTKSPDMGALKRLALEFHEDESGVAMTEYIIIFSLIALGSTIALLSTAVYVKGYRDFLVWWLSHPAV